MKITIECSTEEIKKVLAAVDDSHKQNTTNEAKLTGLNPDKLLNKVETYLSELTKKSLSNS